MTSVGRALETAALPSPLDRRHTMSALDVRYARGQDTRRMFGGGTITNAGSVHGAWDVAPDLERILGEALFGTIWRRGGLSSVQREMITLSTLIVLAREPQLRQHLGNALHIGLTPEQIVERSGRLTASRANTTGVPPGRGPASICPAAVCAP
jgi:4-carboxymuconolactone decarboxylase